MNASAEQMGSGRYTDGSETTRDCSSQQTAKNPLSLSEHKTSLHCSQKSNRSRVTVVGVEPGYEGLASTLTEALDQAQYGKGADRHAHTGEGGFETQIIMTIEKWGVGFHLGQAIKKIVESVTLEKTMGVEAANRERLGAINYIAAKILLSKKQQERR